MNANLTEIAWDSHEFVRTQQYMYVQMAVGLREVAREPGVSHDLEHTRSLGKKHSTNQYSHSGDIYLRFTPFLAVFY